MPLTLEVVGRKAAQMGRSARKVFQRGGTIGRLPDNDWVFPDQYISGHHAKISCVGGKYLIEDTSTNGVFINSPQKRLSRGQAYALRDGDTVYVDDYEMRVSLGDDYGAAESVGGRSEAGADKSLRSVQGGLLDDEPAAGAEDTDPMRLLGLISPPALRTGPRAAALDGGSPLAEHYQPPAYPGDSPILDSPDDDSVPEDYDPFAADELPVAPPQRIAPGAQKRVPKPAAPLSAPVRPVPAQRSATTPMPLPISGAGGTPRRPQARPEAGARQAASPWPQSSGPEPRAPAVPRPGVAGRVLAPGLQAKTPDTDRREPRSGSRAGDLDFGALMAAAGIDSERVNPEVSQQFGKIMRVVVAGLMDVLKARGKIKDEFRMRLTTFKQKDNNPLKFSANVEDALHNILVKRNAAFLGPVEAFEDAFQDVRGHQMAMLAGMRVAFDAMLAEFEPERLQKGFDEQLKSKSFLSGSGKSRYWELYGHKFRDMVKDADSSFRNLFGDEFAKAYEEQLARLRNTKQSDRP